MKRFLTWYRSAIRSKIIVWLGVGLTVFWLSFFSFLLIKNTQIDLDTVKDTVYPTHGSDSEQYTRLAENIRTQQTFSLDRQAPFKPDGFRTIGYPAFLAVWQNFFHTYAIVVVIQFFLLLGTAYVVYRIAINLRLGEWSFVPAVLVALDPAAIFYSFFLLSDTLFNFLLVTSFWLLSISWQVTKPKEHFYYVCATGLVLGLAVLVRPIAIFLPAVYVCASLLAQGWTSVRAVVGKSVCLVLSCLLVISPWMLRNKNVFDTWQLSSVGPVTFFEFTVPEFLAEKRGNTLSQVRNEFHRQIGVPDATDLIIDMAKTPAMMAVVMTELRGNYVEYVVFHLHKTVPFFYTSSLKIFVVGTEPFRSNETLRTIISPPHLGDIKSLNSWTAWLVFGGQMLFLLERLLWFIFSLFACAAVIILRKNTMVRWAVINCLFIGYFAFLTGPVANERYRLPAVPFMALNLTMVLVYWHNQRRLDKMPKI